MKRYVTKEHFHRLVVRSNHTHLTESQLLIALIKQNIWHNSGYETGKQKSQLPSYTSLNRQFEAETLMKKTKLHFTMDKSQVNYSISSSYNRSNNLQWQPTTLLFELICISIESHVKDWNFLDDIKHLNQQKMLCRISSESWKYSSSKLTSELKGFSTKQGVQTLLVTSTPQSVTWPDWA